jgi:potassium efflux system protein
MKSGLNMLKTVVAGLAALMLCIPYLPAHSAAQNAPAQETVATESGEVVLPDQKLIQAMTDEVRKDASLDENTKKERLAELENAMANLAALSQTKKDLFDLKKEIQGSSALLRRLSADLNKAERQYAQIPSCKDRKAKNIDELIDDLQEKAAAAQNELSAAASEYSSLQTLTERAQTAISQNNSALSALSSDIASQSDPGSPAVRIKALNMALLRAQNTLLQEQMQNHPLLLDLAGYRQRIAELKNTYYQKYLQNAVSRQRELISVADNSGDLDEDAIAAAAKESPALAKELAVNKKVSDYLTQYRQEAAALQGEAHSVEQALSSLKQLSASIDTEIKGLDKSLVLSRLLNRQQSQIPDIALSKNLDELIPDLTLWLYDVRERRDAMFDIGKYADSLTGRSPELAKARDELISVIAQRRELLNQLHQTMSSELTTAIDLKLKHAEFEELRDKTSAAVTENLFWLKSNQSLGAEFFRTIIPGISYELSSFVTKLRNQNYWKATLRTLLVLGLPAALLGLVIFFLNPALRRYNNRLAGRLDRRDDSVFVTPAAIVLNFIMVLPKVVLWALIGGLIICLCLNGSNSQLDVIQMLLLHILVFVFFLEILKPNSLAQRHFCISPDILAQDRRLLNRIWYALIPILITANIAEADSSAIYYDFIGYLIMLGCSLALAVVSFRWLRAQLASSDDISALVWFISLACVLAPLTILIAVANGYYYTTIKLVNRFVYTCYTVLLYWIIASTLRRAVYVFQERLARRNREKLLLPAEERTHKAMAEANSSKETNLSYFKESLGLEKLGAKVFKLLNAGLIFITLCLMYLQWADIASALSYLKNVRLWSDVQLIGGKETVIDALTLADVLLAALFIAVAALLNRNLPPLLEKIILWRSHGASHRSTGYTIKIVTSYTIMALGIIFAAGALGIKWENLQWLVAALSVGLGFGLQEIFANFVSGLIILFERQIRVGDIITLDSLSGTVSKIRIRSTTILSFENKEVMIPNRNFITSALTNWSLSSTVTKIEFRVGVGYSSDVNKAKRLLRTVIQRCKYIEKSTAPIIYVSSLDDSAVTIVCEVYVSEIGNRRYTFDYLCTETLRVFGENGIEIPFNQMDVNIKNLEKGEFLDAFKRSSAVKEP